ncbi:hypothetical protein J6590_031822 [Homalodisca vitripennis]|nr:hypothetical protein J6590_031822 [Homalodisca vitripennis]
MMVAERLRRKEFPEPECRRLGKTKYNEHRSEVSGSGGRMADGDGTGLIRDTEAGLNKPINKLARHGGVGAQVWVPRAPAGPDYDNDVNHRRNLMGR